MTSLRPSALSDGSPPSAERILAASPAITYVYDVAEGRSLYQNRSLEALLGYPAPDPSPTAWGRLMHEEDQASFVLHRERMRSLQPGQEITWEYRLRTPDGSWRWFMSRDVLLEAGGDGKPRLVVGTASDITALKAMQTDKDLLLEEARHRTKNFTTVMLAVAQQSAPRPGEAPNAAFDRFVGRLRAILDAGNLVMTTERRTASIHDVLQTSFGTLVTDMSRIAMSGPALVLSEQVAGGLMLVTHELTTNALKYGALSSASGEIRLAWHKIADPNRIRFQWHESGGPPVQAPSRAGFGTRLLKTALPESQVELDYPLDGFHCRFEFDALRIAV